MNRQVGTDKRSSRREVFVTKKKRTSLQGEVLNGAPGRARTADLRVTNALLCQLSHGSVSAAGNSAGYIDPKMGHALKLRVNEGCVPSHIIKCNTSGR